MPKTVTSRTIDIRRRLLDVLRRAHPRPLPTGEIMLALAVDGCNRPPVKGGGDPCPFIPRETCHAWCWYDPVYPQLRALRAVGLVAHSRGINDKRSAYWSHVPDDQSDAYFNAAVGDDDPEEP